MSVQVIRIQFCLHVLFSKTVPSVGYRAGGLSHRPSRISMMSSDEKLSEPETAVQSYVKMTDYQNLKARPPFMVKNQRMGIGLSFVITFSFSPDDS